MNERPSPERYLDLIAQALTVKANSIAELYQRSALFDQAHAEGERLRAAGWTHDDLWTLIEQRTGRKRPT